MYRKVMMQIYLSEDVCKKLYVKIVFRNYTFSKKITKKNLFKKEINLLYEIGISRITKVESFCSCRIVCWLPSRRACAIQSINPSACGAFLLLDILVITLLLRRYDEIESRNGWPLRIPELWLRDVEMDKPP